MTDWRHRAACLNYPAWWWFPDTGHESKQFTPKAKQVCQTCPVLKDCDEYTRHLELSEGRIHGLWAGLTAKERSQTPIPPLEAQCVECQTRFATKSRLARFCSRSCRQIAYYRQHPRDKDTK